MIWCPSCKRPHGHTKWTCACNLNWQNCVKHRPIQLQDNSSLPDNAAVPFSRAMSATASAAKLSKLEPHNSSRLILSPGLAQRFPHLVGAPIGTSSRLPATPRSELRTRVCNHTIHDEPTNEEPQQQEQIADSARPAIAQTPNLPSTSSATAGESSTKKKSRPFRRVVQT